MDQDPWLLLREINRRPLLTLFRQEQAANHGAELRVAGRDLLQVGVGHGYPARNGAAVIRSDLVDVTVNAAICVAVLHNGVDEGAAGLVQVAGPDD